MKRQFLVKFLVSVMAIHCTVMMANAAPRPLTLVKEGRPASVIVVPSAPNGAAVFGAKELQWHLKKVTGTDVPIITDRQKVDAEKVRIMVGESRATRALGITAKGFKRQEYTLLSKGNAIILLGLDSSAYPVELGGNAVVWPNGRFGKGFDGWACLLAKDHSFNDEKGTMEAFIYVAQRKNEKSTGGIIFKIGDDKNGHCICTKDDAATKKQFLSYQTTADGRSQEIAVVGEWAKRSPGWHHLMATWDASANKAEVFFDGKSAGVAPYLKTACANQTYFAIRGDPVGTAWCWGPIDEVQLSRTVRQPVVPSKAFQTDDDTLLLMHFDDPACFARDDSEYPRVSPIEPQADGRSATLYAVYDFLEKYCGVRWYAPTEEGMVCPQKSTLTVTVNDLRRVPALESRASYLPATWGLVGNPSSQDDQRLLNLRLKLGGNRLTINHSFEGFPDRFWEKNPSCPQVFEEYRPDFFEMQEDGSRNPRQICFSSKGLLAQVIKDARAYFTNGAGTHRAIGGEDYYVVAPRDDKSNRCLCPDCRAAVAKAGTNWHNFSSGSASELVYGFLNKVQAAITKSHPGKHIACFNYFDYTYYPKTIKVDPNLYIGPAIGAGWFMPDAKVADRPEAIYQEWVDKMPRGSITSLWMYQCFPWETGQLQGYNVFPDWNAHLISRDMKRFAKDGVRGIFQCGLTPYIDGYLTIKMMDDPTIDIDKELDYFFTSYYGAAAEPMKQLYLAIEQTYTTVANYPPLDRAGIGVTGNSDELSWYWLGRPKRMERFGKLMEEAKTKADTEAAKKHVATYERDIWSYMQEGYRTYVAKQPGGRHPYPFTPEVRSAKPMKWSPPANAPFLTNLLFRDGANGFGVWETGFDDDKGTMEAWIWCGPAAADFCQGEGIIFRICNAKPDSGHRVWVDVDVDKGVFIPKYETFVGGKTSLITGKPLNANQWHHISATWERSGKAGTMNLYADTELLGTAPYRATGCKAECFYVGVDYVGARSRPGTSFGPIDEVRLSNVVRKPTRQKEAYEPDAKTLLLLHFDEAEREPIKDSSMRGNPK